MHQPGYIKKQFKKKIQLLTQIFYLDVVISCIDILRVFVADNSIDNILP